MNKTFSVKRIAFTSITLSVALILGFLESLFPPVIPVLPFVRIGLSSIAVTFALVALSLTDGLIIAGLKSVIVPLFSGNPIMICYSLPASLAASVITYILLKPGVFGLLIVSATAAICHSVVQLFVAAAFTGSFLVFGYTPYMLIISVISGIFTGAASFLLLRVFSKNLYRKNIISNCKGKND